MTRLDSVQALRGIAALAVMLCHLIAIEAGHAGRDGQLTDFFDNGAYGVDLFFVISGFIMVWVAGAVPRGLASAGDFLYARVTRIYPLWWLFAGAMVVFLLLFRGLPWDADRLDPKELDGVTHLIKSFLLWPQPEHPVLGVGWTLVHEMYFYIGFTLLILFLPQRLRLAGILTWGGIVFVGALSGLGTSFGRNLVELVFSPVTLEFVFGAMVAYLIKAGWRRFAWTSIIAGCAGLLIGFLLVDNESGGILLAPLELERPAYFLMMWARVFVFGIPAALLLYGLVALELQNKLTRNLPKPLVEIGDWSYALYLCHMLTISAVGKIVYTVFGTDSVIATPIYFVTAIALSLLVAALSYKWFERPLIGYFRRWRRSPQPSTTGTVNAPAE